MAEKTGYVYKYVDNNDGIVKYVGLVNPGNSLKSRINQHKKDKWYHDQFSIYYTEVSTKTDCEFLESHFITYYHSDKYFNKAKTGWGNSNFVDDKNVIWHLFEFNNDNLRSEIQNYLYERDELNKEINVIKSDISNRKLQINSLRDESINKDLIFPFSIDDIRFLYQFDLFSDIHFISKDRDLAGRIIDDYEVCYDKSNKRLSWRNNDYVWRHFNGLDINDMGEAVINIALCCHMWYPVQDIYNVLYNYTKQQIERFAIYDKEFTYDEILKMKDYNSFYYRDKDIHLTVEKDNGKIKSWLACDGEIYEDNPEIVLKKYKYKINENGIYTEKSNFERIYKYFQNAKVE